MAKKETLEMTIKSYIGKEVEYQTKGVLFEKGTLVNIDEHGYLFSNENGLEFFSHSAGVKIKIIK